MIEHTQPTIEEWRHAFAAAPACHHLVCAQISAEAGTGVCELEEMLDSGEE